ncbi:MAG: hypothetical protein COX29_04345 [Candidatus Moranbacteria bacterium CG23_combo_of_CG06-09_8_20_14_all_35_22]|nr:MAG: hypothetical protein COX29_04345 [Candidatus Moranbacteria bacterium CG23_combo_of_CG06-09_8_20_14_all_35_22]
MNDKKIRILLVDDEQTIRETYADIFRQAGFEVSEAVDGLDGLDKATKEMPDVIFTGIIMPRMDGFALKEALVKNVNTSKIPVMMLSHMGREEDREKAQNLGVKDFIVQGMISPKEIIEKIQAMFGSEGYLIKFSTSELDALKLAEDLHINQRFECPKCSGEMVLKLKIFDVNKQEFNAKFVCPKCG